MPCIMSNRAQVDLHTHACERVSKQASERCILMNKEYSFAKTFPSMRHEKKVTESYVKISHINSAI
jgi:hypothetical protein